MRSSERDYYKVLQVDPEADPEVITAAFRVLARRLHPDRDLTGVHEVRMAELNRAYGVLRHANTRQEYDAQRAQRLSPVGPGSHQDTEAFGMAPPAGRATSVDGTPDGDSMIGGLSARVAMGSASAAERASFAGEVQLDFGRYAGWSIRDLARRDPDYLRWLARHSSGIRFRSEIARILKEPVEDPYAPSR
ncbi:MAG: DnaJ domain-containing protein [Chloroflexota bacterium]